MSDDLNFLYAVSIVLKHEGGLSDDRRDPGGITNFGITIPWLKEKGIKADPQFIRDLTRDRAKQLYHDYMWVPNHYGRIYAVKIATKIMDMAVNMGEVRAHRLVQEALNSLNKENIAVDGIIGHITLDAINGSVESYLHQELRDLSIQYYKAIVRDHPDMLWAEKDWLERALW